MQSLEIALDPRKSLSGKIVSVFLAFVLAFSFSNLFAGGNAFAEEYGEKKQISANTGWEKSPKGNSDGSLVDHAEGFHAVNASQADEFVQEYLISLKGTNQKRPASCEEFGWDSNKLVFYCSICDKVFYHGNLDQFLIPPKDHTFGDWTLSRDATCTEEGEEKRTCTTCGTTETRTTEIKPEAHDWNEGKVTTYPTCVAKGEKTFTCKNNPEHAYTEEVAIDSSKHNIVIDPAVSATCTETGLTEGKHCSVCKEVIEAQESIPAKGHTEEFVAGRDATCTEDGQTVGVKCSVCKIVLRVPSIITAPGHTVVIDKAVEPTCEKDGLTEGAHCSVCNKVLTQQTLITAPGHTVVIDKAVEPTCETDGLTAGAHCSVCNKVLTQQTLIAAPGHTVVIDAAVAATCNETGLTEGFHCSECGEILVEQEEVAALGHDMVTDEAVAATCTTAGKTEGSHCSRCEEATTPQTVIDTLGHNMVTDAAVAPTCTETGLTAGSHCSRCDDVTTAQEVVPATGHAYGEWTVVTAAAPGVAGLERRVCANDATHVEERAIAALPVVPNVTNPTDQTTNPGDQGQDQNQPSTDQTTNQGGQNQTQDQTIPQAPAPDTTIPDNPTPLAAGLGDGDGAGDGADDNAADDEAIDDDANPLADSATIDDDANPLGAFDKAECPYHYVMFFGIFLTLLYGGVVVSRRLGYAKEIDMMDKNLTGSQRSTQAASVRGVQGA